MSSLEVSLLRAGYCVHLEIIAMRNGSFQLREFPAMAALIKHPEKGYILFDSGYTRRFFTETARWPFSLYGHITPVYLKKGESITEQLHLQGIEANQVRYILLSHFHADHIGGCRDFHSATFVAHQEAFAAVKSLTGMKALRAGFIKALLPEDFESRLVTLKDSQAIKLPELHRPFEYGFDVFEDKTLFLVKLPGHTTGQMGLIIPESSTGGYFFIADACWQKASFRKLIPPHWLARFITADWKEYLQTLHRVHEYAGNHPHIAVVPSHCKETLEDMFNAARG